MKSCRPTSSMHRSARARMSSFDHFLSFISKRGNSTFSRRFSTGMRLKVWKIKPTLKSRMLVSPLSSRDVMSSSAILTLPPVGVSMQPMMFSRVVFPLPDGPTIETNSPSFT